MKRRVKQAGSKPEVRPWTTRELELLRTSAHLGAEAIGALLERTPKAVRRKAANIGVSVRRMGERRGKLLTEPREGFGRTEAIAELRAAVGTGQVSMTAVAERARVIDEAPLCPLCMVRTADVVNSGLCRPCHADRIRRAFGEVKAGHEADKMLDRERQRRKRARTKKGENE